MGWKRGELRLHFDLETADTPFKTSRVRCKQCKSAMSRSAMKIQTHIDNCRHLPGTVGRPNSVVPTGDAAPDLSTNNSLQGSTLSKVSIGTLTNLLRDTLTRKVKRTRRTLDLSFARAIHRTATLFYFFDEPL